MKKRKTKQKQIDEAWTEYVKTINQENEKYENFDRTAYEKYEKDIEKIEKEFENKSTDIKLKTLNDIPMEDYMRLIIKKEGIKWYHRSDDNKHKFIREFFDIMEEDL